MLISFWCFDVLKTKTRGSIPSENPKQTRIHLYNMIIVLEMIGYIVGVYNGKTLNQVGILKPKKICHYLTSLSSMKGLVLVQPTVII